MSSTMPHIATVRHHSTRTQENSEREVDSFFISFPGGTPRFMRLHPPGNRKPPLAPPTATISSSLAIGAN